MRTSTWLVLFCVATLSWPTSGKLSFQISDYFCRDHGPSDCKDTDGGDKLFECDAFADTNKARKLAKQIARDKIQFKCCHNCRYIFGHDMIPDGDHGEEEREICWNWAYYKKATGKATGEAWKSLKKNWPPEFSGCDHYGEDGRSGKHSNIEWCEDLDKVEEKLQKTIEDVVECLAEPSSTSSRRRRSQQRARHVNAYPGEF